MPRVPRADQTPAPTAPLPGVRVSTQAPAGAFGGQPQAIDTTGLQRSIRDIVRVEQEKADQVAVLDADNQLAKLQTSLLHDPKTGVLTRKGRNAFTAPEEVDAAWQKSIAEIEKGLATERQRDAFRARVPSRWESVNVTVQRHVAGEIQAHDTETANAALAMRLDTALRSASDPNIVASALAETRAIVADYGRRAGWSPEQTDEKRSAAVSRIHAGVIESLLTAGHDDRASEYFAAARGEIGGPQVAAIEKALEQATTESAGMRAADEVWGQLGPKSLLDPVKLSTMEQALRDRMAGAPAAKTRTGVVDRIEETPNGPVAVVEIEEADGKLRFVNVPATQLKGAVEGATVEIGGPKTGVVDRIEDSPNGPIAVVEVEEFGQIRFLEIPASELKGAAEGATVELGAASTTPVSPKVVKAAIAELRSRVTAFNAEQRETAAANKATLLGLFNDGGSLAAIQRRPEYRALSGADQEQITSYVVDRSTTLTNRAEDDRQRRGFATYWQLSEPRKLAAMSENEILALEPTLGRALVAQLMQQKRTVLKSDDRVLAATIDDDLFKTIAQSAGLNPYGTSLKEEERANLGRLRVAVENEIDALQAKANRPATREEKTAVMQRIIDETVMRDVIGRDEPQIARLVTRDANGRLPADIYVPIERVPTQFRGEALNWLRSVGSIRANVDDAAALKKLGDRIGKAYAARLAGASTQETQAILKGQR